jgi:biotin operon repressor
MERIERQVAELGDTIKLHNADPVTRLGFTQVPNVILKNDSLSFGAKVTYSMFLSYAWHNNSAFPGQGRVAEDLGITERQIRRLVQELKDAGLLEVQRRGLGKTNIYHLYLTVKKKK